MIKDNNSRNGTAWRIAPCPGSVKVWTFAFMHSLSCGFCIGLPLSVWLHRGKDFLGFTLHLDLLQSKNAFVQLETQSCCCMGGTCAWVSSGKTSLSPIHHCFMQTFSAQTELQDCRCTPYNPPSLILYRIRKIEQQLDNLTRCPVLTKHLLFLLGGEKQTAINWECAINSYGNKVSKYLIIAYVCKYLLTRFA